MVPSRGSGVEQGSVAHLLMQWDFLFLIRTIVFILQCGPAHGKVPRRPQRGTDGSTSKKTNGENDFDGQQTSESTRGCAFGSRAMAEAEGSIATDSLSMERGIEKNGGPLLSSAALRLVLFSFAFPSLLKHEWK